MEVDPTSGAGAVPDGVGMCNTMGVGFTNGAGDGRGAGFSKFGAGIRWLVARCARTSKTLKSVYHGRETAVMVAAAVWSRKLFVKISGCREVLRYTSQRPFAKPETPRKLLHLSGLISAALLML